ncbi:hypothetical protein SCP_1801160 [Sparassis crispa]|uniref:Uncharacterized protein n=1 Tax=Sparassis crispa TaxID=139825 RepID=A0A401H6Q6_9APHY|nr:hypothetical protein SCP_1801160 [Sparassis crispa]GBE90092.1 hypothetical protein SCP_1801160 [Sparassis crispa]
MPGYCHDRLQKVMQDLQQRLNKSPPRLPSWIHVNAEAIPRLLEALQFWATVPGTLHTREVLEAHKPTSWENDMAMLNNPSVSPEYRERALHFHEQKRQDVMSEFQRSGPKRLRQMGIVDPGPGATPAQRQKYEERYQAAVETMMDIAMTDIGSLSFEKLWYDRTKVFLPPQELWSRHPAFDTYRGLKKLDPQRLVDQNLTLTQSIAQCWKANPTLVDSRNKKRQPFLNPKPFETPAFIEGFNTKYRLNGESAYHRDIDSPTFTVVNDFFVAVAKAIKGMPGRITLEILSGELMQELAKMRLKTDHTRPSEFPRSYTRAYISNVPDYAHGMINTVVYALPVLQVDKEAGVASTCLLNPGIWRNEDEFCYTYTLLRLYDLPKYFGCRVIEQDVAGHLRQPVFTSSVDRIGFARRTCCVANADTASHRRSTDRERLFPRPPSQ